MKHNHLFKFLFCSALAAAALTGCGPQEKPAELTQLEDLRNSEESAQINGAAPEAYKACTDLTEKAVNAWQDGEQSQAKVYAALGQRQYATARAVASMADANKRKDTAEQEIKIIEEQLKTEQVKLDGLEKHIELLKTTIAGNDMANVENRIQIAMTEREKAVGVEAATTQKDIFDQAEAKLTEAGNLNAAGKRDEASAAAEAARALFTEAFEKAKPDFDKKQLAAQSAERQKSLFNEAQAIVGPTYVFTDMQSTVIVIASAFEKNKAEILPIKQDAIRRIAELIKKYGDVAVTIEGHVQKSTKDYFGVSQLRADTTRDFLITQGVDYNRIMTTAKGKEILRYDEKKKENRAMNDRVEIIITLK